MMNMDEFTKFKLIKLLDIYKYNPHFMSIDPELKKMLEAKLEFKINQKLEENEEEEFEDLNVQ